MKKDFEAVEKSGQCVGLTIQSPGLEYLSLSTRWISLLATQLPGQAFNPLSFKIKIWILICCPYSFPTEVVGRSW